VARISGDSRRMEKAEVKYFHLREKRKAKDKRSIGREMTTKKKSRKKNGEKDRWLKCFRSAIREGGRSLEDVTSEVTRSLWRKLGFQKKSEKDFNSSYHQRLGGTKKGRIEKSLGGQILMNERPKF